MTITSANRPIQATTPLGGDVLVAVSLTAEEEISRPFLYTVDFVSTEPAITAASMLGKPVTLKFPLGTGSRVVHGLVRRFANLGRQRDLSHYRAEVVPALWFLNLSSNCRTFEDLSPLAIVEKVCKDAGVTDIQRRVSGEPSPIPYVVQYRESDFAFVSRLLEEAGLYYMFEHTNGKHTLVFSDVSGGSIPAGQVAKLTVNPQTSAGEAPPDTVFEITREFQVHPETVSALEHDLLTPSTLDRSNSSSPGARGEWFEFFGDIPARSRSGIDVVRLIEMHESAHDVIRGRSNAPSLQAGTRVTLTGDAFGAVGLELHLTQVAHTITIGDVRSGDTFAATHECRFAGVPTSLVFYRPPRTTLRPSVRGTQTAKIVGAGGPGAIDVDAEGRVLLEFPWDRGAGVEGKSKHRVHVASAWAGTAWGFVQLPRVGQEVLVEYLEGDLDRPIVTGRVYSSSHKPPYALPAKKTQSGWKSRTLGGTDENFNEIRFDDDKGKEHVHVQAEKDLQVLVKNDETRTVGHDRMTTIKNADTRFVTEGDDQHTIEKGDHYFEVTKGDHMLHVMEGKQDIMIEKDQVTIINAGDCMVEVNKGNAQTTVHMGNLTIAVKQGNVSIKADLGKITLEAMQAIELKVGGSTLKLDQTGVQMKGAITVKIEAPAMTEVKGAMLKLEGQAMTQVKAPMTMVNGDGMLIAKGGITMIN